MFGQTIGKRGTLSFEGMPVLPSNPRKTGQPVETVHKEIIRSLLLSTLRGQGQLVSVQKEGAYCVFMLSEGGGVKFILQQRRSTVAFGIPLY